jgi:hypothetical protein
LQYIQLKMAERGTCSDVRWVRPPTGGMDQHGTQDGLQIRIVLVTGEINPNGCINLIHEPEREPCRL